MDPFHSFVDADDMGYDRGTGKIPVIVVGSEFDGLHAIATVIAPDGQAYRVRAGLLYYLPGNN